MYIFSQHGECNHEPLVFYTAHGKFWLHQNVYIAIQDGIGEVQVSALKFAQNAPVDSFRPYCA